MKRTGTFWPQRKLRIQKPKNPPKTVSYQKFQKIQTFNSLLTEWDEREEISDPDDVQPEDWEKPEHIPDPDADKPDDWDDDMDGDWEPPMIDNPEFKGKIYRSLLVGRKRKLRK